MTQIAALFDVDGTLTTDNVWRGLMLYFARRGRRRLTHLAFRLAHYPVYGLRRLGLLSEAAFRRQWASHLPWYFRGFDGAQMQALAHWVAHDFVAAVTRAGALARLRDHLQAGHLVALVSGAPQPLVDAIARMWEVPHAIGSPVEVRAGRYAGRMPGPPCIDEHKAAYARRYFDDRRLAVDYAASFAYADSYSDLGMFELAGHPVAVAPDDALRALAVERGWPVME